jgi:N-acetylglucosaminyldiphosphoundecaprenol N-acetyl-beta-D-mannosaminyltransferase
MGVISQRWLPALTALVDRLGATEPDWHALCEVHGGCRIVTFANPVSVDCQSRHPEYLGLLAQFDDVFADGMLLARLASVLRREKVKRLSFDGSSVATKVFAWARQTRARVALVGAREGIAAQAANVLRAEGIEVAYTRSGYFDSEAELTACLEHLQQSGATLVIAGMGVLHQERFLLKLKASGYRGVAFSCGGYLDQLVERGVYYYPRLFNALNLRWLYRVYREPRRLLRRYLFGYFPFYVSAGRLLLSSGARVKEDPPPGLGLT